MKSQLKFISEYIIQIEVDVLFNLDIILLKFKCLQLLVQVQ